MEPMTAQMPDATMWLFICLEVALCVSFYAYLKLSK